MLLVERAWPPLVWGLAVAILFLAVSWLGVWLFAPRALRIAGVALFALGLVAALAPLLRLRWPAARDVQARLDRDSGEAHHPATSFADRLANDRRPGRAGAMGRASGAARTLGRGDPGRAARAAHGRARPLRAPLRARRCWPSPRRSRPGPSCIGRFAAAFDWRGGDAAAAAAESRIDAWIDPPPYAGRPPMVIDFKSAEAQKLTVFEDSTLVVRGDPAVVETRVEGPIAPLEAKTASPDSQPRERRWTIHGDGKATILRGGTTAAEVVFAVTPAGTPTIKLTEEPRANLSGSLTLAYRLDDRYGVSSARADFALPHDASKPAPRSLAQPPQAALQLPASENGVGDARTTADLSEHPWAGARVTMTLSALSVSGKTGTSAPVEVTLPQRAFHNPLARALVEQRRDLILDPDHAPKRVEAALTGLSVAPELFDTPASVYLGIEAGPVLARSRARRRRPPRRRRVSLGDGPADRGRRRLAGGARSARRRKGAARSAQARRERRRDQEADAGPARGGQALRRRDGAQEPSAAASRARKSRTSRRRISTS